MPFDWNEETDGPMPINDTCIEEFNEENTVRVVEVSNPPATGGIHGKTYIGLLLLAGIGIGYSITKIRNLIKEGE